MVFNAEKISPSTTRITCPTNEKCYLVEGSNIAALLDTGTGVGDLRGIINDITTKPVIALVTHGHVDHASGAAQFENAYMPYTDAYIWKEHGDMSFRKSGLETCPIHEVVNESDLVPSLPIERFLDLQGGQIFNLGGIDIEVFSCPGHTKGSVVFLVVQERALLLGDACNTATFMQDYYSTSIEEYAENLWNLKKQVDGKYDRVYLSHGPGDGDIGLIEGVIKVCEDIKNGKTDDIPFTFNGVDGYLAKAMNQFGVRLDGGIGNIVYNKKNIWK